ncbi:MAG: 16S rRNA (guanine(527)-N(7))-methyltransferase RsmG [Nevskia sp.]
MPEPDASVFPCPERAAAMSPAPMPHAERRLRAGLSAMQLPDAAVPGLMAWLAELEKWNAAYNLSGIRNAEEIVTRHILDSLSLLPLLPAGRLVDIGSGAGIPGLILAIANPSLQVVTLDSNGKKARFMRHAIRALGLKNAEVFEGRAEDHAPAAPYDFIVSRAFSGLGDFLRMTAHLAAPGGKWLAMKGKLDASEQKDLAEGFQIVDVKPLFVPGLDEARHLIVAERP